jgi:inner membrane protein involved in colicin E2 resistance
MGKNETEENKAIPEEIKKNDSIDISDDIEKDINIDVNINNNSSSIITYSSSITINYYNNEKEESNNEQIKNKQKKYLVYLPEKYISKLDMLKSKTGRDESKLATMAYDLLFKKLDIQSPKKNSPPMD